jgi:replicative DNA helicase
LFNVARKRTIILGYTELLEDQALNEEYREILKDTEVPICKSASRAHRLIKSLDDYRKVRLAYEMSKSTIEALKKSEVDVDQLLDSLTSSITQARTRASEESFVFNVRDNGDDLAAAALDVTDEIFLKTSFSTLDNKAGGLPSEGVMLMAATTSGGKSTVLMNLLSNLYYENKISVANCSLEMNEKKLTRRMMSSLSGIPYWKFNKKQLTKEERRAAKRAMRKLREFGEEHDIDYGIICPREGKNITQLLTVLKPYGYKVIGIDYVSLLEGVDEKDQWRVLSAILRQCKIYSEANHCLIIVLAQLSLDDDTKIRYSGGMLEHADVAVTWSYFKPEVRETKRIPVRVMKYRDAELFTFELEEQFEVMTVLDKSSEDGAQEQDGKATEEVDLSDSPEVDYDAGSR